MDTTVMVNEYYLPDWKAVAHGSYGGKEISTTPILMHFIGMKIPAGTTSVNLIYRPVIRIILEIISYSTLSIFTAFLAWLLVTGWIRARKN
jgi:uncharacterized membrane protein YfhO